YKGAGPVPIIDQTVKDQMSVAYTVPYQMITGAELPVADTSPEAMQQAVREGLAKLQA
ncbi:hypothetical protein HY469_02040, partial [Candidatus Roizmanbacteria bacterium]|nr:hypothetical protein [Candidatus Roizmanbacteria bacterium]